MVIDESLISMIKRNGCRFFFRNSAGLLYVSIRSVEIKTGKNIITVKAFRRNDRNTL